MPEGGTRATTGRLSIATGECTRVGLDWTKGDGCPADGANCQRWVTEGMPTVILALSRRICVAIIDNHA